MKEIAILIPCIALLDRPEHRFLELPEGRKGSGTISDFLRLTVKL